MTYPKELEKYLPLAVNIRLEDGKVQGLTELSFGMNWSDKTALISWSGTAYSILGEHDLNGPRDAENSRLKYYPTTFCFDPLSEDCPIEVDWDKWLAARNAEGEKFNKFNARNAPFKVKPHGVWQMRALYAERDVKQLKKTWLQMGAQNIKAVELLMNHYGISVEDLPPTEK